MTTVSGQRHPNDQEQQMDIFLKFLLILSDHESEDQDKEAAKKRQSWMEEKDRREYGEEADRQRV